MFYIDTSLLVAALSHEQLTKKAQAWLAALDPEELAISDWTVTELSSAFAIKVRTGQIDMAARAASLSMFNKLSTESFAVLPIASIQFRTAASFVDRNKLGLRAATRCISRSLQPMERRYTP